MKTGIASLLIGIIGLAIATYFYYQTAHLAQLQDVATGSALNYPASLILFILEAAGAVAGFLSYKKWRVKVGLLGMGLCTLSLILILYYLF